MNKSIDYFLLLIKGVEELNLLVQIDKEMVTYISSIRARELSYLLGRMQALSLQRCVVLTAALLDKKSSKHHDKTSIPLLFRHLKKTNLISKSVKEFSDKKISELKSIYDACKHYRDKFVAHIENVSIVESHILGFSQFAIAAQNLSDLCDLISNEVFSRKYLVERTFERLAEIQQLKKLSSNL
ncbi:MAG TPA: hypothetical protein VGH42_02395 [Verrucomicrobiae bacterium]|jgi:hypothetical protein